MVHLGEVSPAIWDSTIELLQEKIPEFNVDEYERIVSNWKKLANIRKFDRELFEKYGYFKPIILHPQFQRIKAFLLEHSVDFDFGLFVGEPLLPWSTSIIVLFMLHKRISLSILLLGAAFVFNVNPLYVVLLFIPLLFSSRGKSLPKGYQRNPMINSNHSRTMSSAPISLDLVPTDIKFDHILVGNDIATLYTAALLSRVGHRCCVLQSVDGPVHEVFPEGAPCSAAMYDMSVSKVHRYQVLLDAAQSTSAADRVTFTPVGTSEDGYTSAVIEIHDHSTGIILDASSGTDSNNEASSDLNTPEVSKRDIAEGASDAAATDGSVDSTDGKGSFQRHSYAPQRRKVFSLRVGMFSFVSDMCALLPLDKTQFSLYTASFANSLQYIRAFLLSRVASSSAYQRSGHAQTANTKQFKEFIGSNIEQVVFKCEPEAASPLLSVLSAVSAVGAKEGLVPSESTALNLALGLVGAAEGVFWPVGGYTAVVRALCATIRQSGGEVYRDVRVNRLVLSSSGGAASEASAYKAEGVEITVGQGEGAKSVVLKASQSVVSGMGVLCTYTRLLPASGGSVIALSAETRAALNGLTETRPRHRVVYWVDCSGANTTSADSGHDLGLSSTDYFEIGNHSGEDNSSSQRSSGSSNSSDAVSDSKYLHIWCPTAKDPSWKQKVHVVVVEFDASVSLFQVKDVSIHKPAAATSSDPPTTDAEAGSSDGVDVGSAVNVSSFSKTDASTTLSPPSFHPLGQTLSFNNTTLSTIRSYADSRLAHAYPQVMQHIVCVSVQPLRVGGHVLANTTHKYVSPLSSTTEIQNFYLTGKDLSTVGLAGDIQSGWATANAVLGYTTDDLSNTERNVVMDLENVKK